MKKNKIKKERNISRGSSVDRVRIYYSEGLSSVTASYDTGCGGVRYRLGGRGR